VKALAETAAQVTARMAPSVVELLATRLETGSPLGSLRALVPATAFAAGVDELLAASANATPREVAAALRSAAAVHASDRERTVEVVWTGPPTPRLPVRLTAQALKQLIEGAQDRLIVASFAVYDIEDVSLALYNAADRGVQVQLILESVTGSGGKMTFEGATQLGRQTLERCHLLTWPLNRRPRVHGSSVSLHAKFAVADGRCLLTTSANLTGHALELNMELGVLITGGEAPREVVRLVDDLIAQGDLVTYTPVAR
jgi:cardiolipin synthase A/B